MTKNKIKHTHGFFGSKIPSRFSHFFFVDLIMFECNRGGGSRIAKKTLLLLESVGWSQLKGLYDDDDEWIIKRSEDL